MKNFISVVIVAIVCFVAMGIVFPSSEIIILKNGVSIGLLLFTFVLVPTFLFYAYDRKQSRKEIESEEKQEQ